MPQGEGTYGDKVGRPPKKKKKEDSSEGSSILTSKPKKDY